jgi:hypothetical protein
LNSIETVTGIYSGFADFENNVAKYWKNGIPIILGDVSNYSAAKSIFLVKK